MLGFSFVSFIEILYWLSGRLARNCMRKSGSEEGLTVAELGNVRKVSVYENVQMSDLSNTKIGNCVKKVTNGSAAKYSIPPPPPSDLLYDNEADIEDEDHYYR